MEATNIAQLDNNIPLSGNRYAYIATYHNQERK